MSESATMTQERSETTPPSPAPAPIQAGEDLNFNERIQGPVGSQSAIARAIALLQNGDDVWRSIAQEGGGLLDAFVPYTLYIQVIPLAISAVVGHCLSSALALLSGEAGSAMSWGFMAWPAFAWLWTVVITLVLAKVVDLVSPSFNGKRSWLLATRLVIYSATPQFLSSALTFIPLIGGLLWLVSLVWSFLLFRRGFRVMLRRTDAPAI